MTPSAAQFRAARAWLRLSMDQVAFGCGLNVTTVQRVERGVPSLKVMSINRVRAFYVVRGLTFTESGGIERTTP